MTEQNIVIPRGDGRRLEIATGPDYLSIEDKGEWSPDDDWIMLDRMEAHYLKSVLDRWLGTR